MRKSDREEFDAAVGEIVAMLCEDPYITAKEAIPKLKNKFHLQSLRKFLERRDTDGWIQIYPILKEFAEREWALGVEIRRHCEHQGLIPLRYEPYRKKSSAEIKAEQKAFKMQKNFSLRGTSQKEWESKIKPEMLGQSIPLEEINRRKKLIVGAKAKIAKARFINTTGEAWNIKRLVARATDEIRKQIEIEGGVWDWSLNQIKKKMKGGNRSQQSKAWAIIRPMFLPSQKKRGEWRLKTRKEFSLLFEVLKYSMDPASIYGGIYGQLGLSQILGSDYRMAFSIYGGFGRDKDSNLGWGW